jgi:hypothetical protein
VRCVMLNHDEGLVVHAYQGNGANNTAGCCNT